MLFLVPPLRVGYPCKETPCLALTSTLLLLIALIPGCNRGPSVEELNRLEAKADKEREIGKYADAAEKYYYIAQHTQAVLGPTSKQFALTLNLLAMCWSEMGRFGGADSAYTTAETIFKRYPEMDSVRAVCLSRHAYNKVYQKDYTAAIPLFAEGLRIVEKLHGPNDPHLEKFLEGLNLCYSLQRDFTNALSINERQLSVMLANPRFRAASTMGIIDWLWRPYWNIPRVERGNQFFSKALAAVDSGLTRDRRSLPYLELGFAGYLWLQQRFPEANVLFEKAATHAEEVFGRDTKDQGEFLSHYARILRQLGATAGAEEVQKKADILCPENSALMDSMRLPIPP
jgi:tetratricopeptide (TPR) repeat protein